MTRILTALVVIALVQVDPQALQRMVATERAFAAATGEIGVRDGFLTFFAADAVQLSGTPEGRATVEPARATIAGLAPPKLPLASKLMWEPFTGQISGDGVMGWLTGAYVNLTETSHDIVGKGAYFSIWKRQADGTYRVWIDQGITIPQVWNDASPFRVAPDPDAGTSGQPNESMADAERDASSGGAAWRARLSAAVRLHRDGEMPLVGREAASEWAARAWTSVRYTPARTETAGSGDLGVVLGGYLAQRAAGPDAGTFIRVWKRDVPGRWRIVFETSKMSR